MEFDIQYWHWIILGMVLMLAELAITTFTLFWFGLGALVVAAILAFIPSLDIGWQLGIWAIASIVFTVLWFRYFRRFMQDRTRAGVNGDAIIGEAGMVIKVPVGEQRGVVRFTPPLMGNEEWTFFCHQEVEIGDRVFVKELSGNTLIVEKRS